MIRVVTGASASCSRSAIGVPTRTIRRRRVLGPSARERRAFREASDSRRLISVSQSLRALGDNDRGDGDGDVTAVPEPVVYNESIATFIARSTRAWIAQQPQNLRNVTPLLHWPNEKLFALSTLKGTLKNTLAVLLGMVLMIVFLGGADALLLAFQAKFARPLLA